MSKIFKSEEPYFKSNPRNSNYNYVTRNTPGNKSGSNAVDTRVSRVLSSKNLKEFQDSFPMFLSDTTTVSLPAKVKRQIDKLPNKVLKPIDSNILLAKEKCLLVVSNLTSTVFMDDEEDRWKNLSSKILHQQVRRVRDNTIIYKRVIEALLYHTKNTSAIIEVKLNQIGKETYQEGEFTKAYRLSSDFTNQNIKIYHLKCDETKLNRERYFYSCLSRIMHNTIVKNLLIVYQSIELPTMKEIQVEGDRLIKSGYKNKKGKTLTKLNKRPKSYFDDEVERSFVEENIKQFNYLTGRGFMIPSISDKKAGGRVTDSFTLMPSWIRKLCKLEGERLVEVDYAALHPNIVQYLYDGNMEYITHSRVAIESGLDLNQVKVEHLSFFNMHPSQMQKSILYDYYIKQDEKLVDNIIMDKSLYHYTITSRKLFSKEVELISECVARLNKKGIYVLYVYDALYCKVSEVHHVVNVMNKVAKQYSVHTTAKYGYGLIYTAKNMNNKMVYVGATTKSLFERKQDHIQKAKKGSELPLHKAIRKFGEHSFNWTVVDIANNVNELANKEVFYITEFNAIDNGYNRDSGGGFKKIVYSVNPNSGLMNTYESLSIAAESVSGEAKSISNACLGYIKTYKGLCWSYDKTFDIRALSDARKKEVIQLNFENKVIAKFESVSSAARKTGLSKSSISRVCRGERDKSGGYRWKYN
ncbi:NUMOD1 domain-containing DNA-binding protein [Croceivirga radicis]|uniref:NUMOD1 domain-containing DNA-binding protein n=1 Tax=Croceivirga radicis TaxID=1929488 RepID=UPI000255AED2|nr:NUMOD1 domain-containing DNA-binding protein [Croceivirga radicis]